MSKVCVFIGEGFEEIEALTVVDVLRRNNIFVELVSITENLEVKGAHNIKVVTDGIFEHIDFDDVEMIVLPGGMPGTINLKKHKGLEDQISRFAGENKKIAAICAAPSILGNLGILTGRKATCFPGFEKELFGAEFVNEAVVIDGNIITSQRMETALAFSNSIVNILKSK